MNSTRDIEFEGARATLIVVTDITYRKHEEEILKRDKNTFEKLVRKRTEELLKAQQQLEQSRRLSDIGTLAATVAHELRNPLATIRTAVYNIKRKRKSAAIDKHIANIDKKVLESDQIINNLLFYSRLKMPDSKKIVLCELIDECVESSSKRFPKWKVSVSKKYQVSKKYSMDGDPVQLGELFDNVLNNAYEAMENEKGKIKVAVEESDKKILKISFSDNGCGIDPSDLERVTQPFMTTKSRGTGLGFTVCSQIVNLHGGKLDIHSTKGVGTTVEVYIPVKKPKK
jgi:signal transduction histidine kinase